MIFLSIFRMTFPFQLTLSLKMFKSEWPFYHKMCFCLLKVGIWEVASTIPSSGVTLSKKVCVISLVDVFVNVYLYLCHKSWHLWGDLHPHNPFVERHFVKSESQPIPIRHTDQQAVQWKRLKMSPISHSQAFYINTINGDTHKRRFTQPLQQFCQTSLLWFPELPIHCSTMYIQQ